MRRSDREITDIRELIQVMEKCDVCRLALHDEEYPYILPLNFGMQKDHEQIVLFFHGAMSGKKFELMAKDNRASFEMDCEHELVMDTLKRSCTMAYESVIGHGRIEMVDEDEKYEALCRIMEHYHQEAFPFNTAVMPHTKVFKLVVEQVSGKRRKKK